MSPVGAVVLLSAVGVAGMLLVISGWLQPAPSLRRTIDHLQRSATTTSSSMIAGSTAGRRLYHQPRQRLVPGVG